MIPDTLKIVSPSEETIILHLKCSVRAGPWMDLDHIYEAGCGCKYSVRAYGRGAGWDYICPTHRGNIEYITSEKTRSVLPYRCSTEEYLKDCSDEAFIAFLEGRNYFPRTFEYGTNAGDYVSPLVSKDGELWYYNVRQSECTHRAVISRREVA